MSTLVEEGKGPEELGTILARLQDDLQLIRSTVARAGEGEVDMGALDSVLSRTERGVQAASEQVLSSQMNQVSTLPPIQGGQRTRRRRRRRAASEERATLREMAEMSSQHSPIQQARYSSLTPGEQSQARHRARLLSQPTLPAARKLLTQQYSLPHRDEQAHQGSKVTPAGHLFTGATIQPLPVLPQTHRRNAMLTPPPISRHDAQRGLLSLLERQLIPPAAEIVLSPPPVKPKSVQLLSPSQQFVPQKTADERDVMGHLVGVKLAPSHLSIPSAEQRRTATPPQPTRPAAVRVRTVTPPQSITQRKKVTPSRPTPHPPSPTTLQIIIQNGHTLTVSQDFQLFQKSEQQNWKNIAVVLGQLEEMCTNYAIPIAMADSEILKELASDHELGLRIRRQDLLSCLLNAKDVERLLRRPGQRYKGAGKLSAAATKIQATFRMFRQRSLYLEYRRRRWAAGVITMAWIMFARRYRMRLQLSQRRARELASHRERASALRERWSTIQQSRRVIIHLPSLGYPSSVRTKLSDFNIQQSQQIARICDIQDPNVEVVYVSGVELGQEVKEYYSKMLGMGVAGGNAMERVHIITPEHLLFFPSHRPSLASLLTLSPRTIQRIKHLIAGRETYIVPHLVSSEDLTVADLLGVPLLGPDCEVTQLYSTRAGARKLFAEAKVPCPPHVADIFSHQQLIDQLAHLVTNNLSISRWLFKLPCHTSGKGFAYCDVIAYLQCYPWVLRESQRYGEKWSKKWAQEYALQHIIQELPSILSTHTRPVNSDLFPSWDDFLAEFLVKGGLIEGTPPSDSVTSLTVDMLIEPTGNIRILSTQDQVCPQPHQVWGVSLPQSSVPPHQLLSSAQEVGVACRDRGIVGYLSVDYVTFIHPKTLSQELWAVDLDLGYSDHLALHNLLSYITGASLDPVSGQLTVDGRPCFSLLSPHLHHTNLSVLQYPVFLQMCKAHHIGYDAKEKQGTLFTLVDEEHRDHLGIMCLQPTLQLALSSASLTLSTIHQEISTPLMQGTSNFQVVCQELDSIAKLVGENLEQGGQRAEEAEEPAKQ